MDPVSKIILVAVIGFLLTPIVMLIGGAAYMVYSPRISSYNTIEECEFCRNRDTPYCRKCWRCKWNPLYWVHKRLIYNGPDFVKRAWLARHWEDNMTPNISKCRACGAPIIWKRTAAGKLMPCDIYPRTVVPNPRSKIKLLDQYGQLLPCDIVDEPGINTELAHMPHWATCSDPNRFRESKTR